MAVQTEHVLFRPEYQAGEQGKTLAPTEQQQLSHAFTETPSVFQLLSTVRSRRFGMGYRYETGESEPCRGARTARLPLSGVRSPTSRPLTRTR